MAVDSVQLKRAMDLADRLGVSYNPNNSSEVARLLQMADSYFRTQYMNSNPYNASAAAGQDYYAGGGDPFAGFGYGSGFAGNNPIGGMNSGALGAMYNAAGQIGAAQAQAAGNVGSANAQGYWGNQTAGTQGLYSQAINEETQRALQAIADMQSSRQLQQTQYGADRSLDATRDTNKTNLGLGGLNLQGIQNTNATNQNIAGIQGQTQLGVANINSLPQQQKNAILAQLLGVDPSALGNLNLGGLGGIGGGTGTGTGSNTSTTGGGGLSTATYSAPKLPNFQGFNPLLQQQQLAGQTAGINTAYGTARNDMMKRLGQGGFTMNSPGVAAMQGQMRGQQIGDTAKAQRDIALAGQQFNAQNALGYANSAQNAYSAEQDRINQYKIAELAKNAGLSNTIFSGLLS